MKTSLVIVRWLLRGLAAAGALFAALYWFDADQLLLDWLYRLRCRVRRTLRGAEAGAGPERDAAPERGTPAPV